MNDLYTGWCWHCNHLRETKQTSRGWVCKTCNLSMVQRPTGRTSVYGNGPSGHAKPTYSPKLAGER